MRSKKYLFFQITVSFVSASCFSFLIVLGRWRMKIISLSFQREFSPLRSRSKESMRDSFFSSLLLVGEAKKRGASPRAIDGAKNLKITRTAGSHSCSRLDTHTSHLSPNGNPINNNPRDWMLIIPLLPQVTLSLSPSLSLSLYLYPSAYLSTIVNNFQH